MKPLRKNANFGEKRKLAVFRLNGRQNLNTNENKDKLKAMFVLVRPSAKRSSQRMIKRAGAQQMTVEIAERLLWTRL